MKIKIFAQINVGKYYYFAIVNEKAFPTIWNS